jgi:hypothetical protein
MQLHTCSASSDPCERDVSHVLMRARAAWASPARFAPLSPDSYMHNGCPHPQDEKVHALSESAKVFVGPNTPAERAEGSRGSAVFVLTNFLALFDS